MSPARRPALLAALAALLLAPAALRAAPQPIDLATTLRLAGADNLSVRIAREKLAEARAEADVARERMFPWVTAGMALRQHENNLQTVEGRIIDADKRSFAAGVGLNAQWDIGEVYYQKLAAQQRARAEEAALATQRQTSTYEAAVAYFELLRAAETIAVATDALALSERYYEQIKASGAAGVAFAGDVQRVATQRARNETAVQQAREQARVAAARLAELLKLDPMVELTPASGELVPVTLVDATSDLATLVARALAARPELTQADARLAAVREAHNGARNAPLVPVVSAQVNVGGLGGDTGLRSWSRGFDSSNDYGIGLSWRIGPGGLFDRSRVRSSEARLRRSELELEQTRDSIRRQVVEFHARAESLRTQLKSLRTAMDAAEQTARLSRERRAQSVSGVLEDLLAEEELTRARRDYVAAIAQFDQSQYALLRVVGGELPAK
ncbi:MAG: TolC family protein [Verrucomicrobia bacterium]|nr:TolC family protein [Verrucomicrobiota bacterium]